MQRIIRPLAPTMILAAACLGLAGPAQAQSFGLYRGQTTEGDTIEITVGDDGAGGPAVLVAAATWTATCTRSGPGRGVSWGVGSSQPIVNRRAVLDFRFNGLYEHFVLRFNAAGNQVTGSFVGRTPEFVDAATNTRQVQLCETGVRNFSADLQPALLRPVDAPAAGQARMQGL